MTAIGQPVIVAAPYHSKNGWTELIRVQVQAARIAGEHISARALNRVLDTVDRACALPAKPGWERKAAAHAELFRLLADVAGGSVTSGAADGQAGLIRDLMCAVGPGANGMISSSRRRLIDQLRTGDAYGAALEMENHLRTLRYMWLLAQPSGPNGTSMHHRRPGRSGSPLEAWTLAVGDADMSAMSGSRSSTIRTGGGPRWP